MLDHADPHEEEREEHAAEEGEHDREEHEPATVRPVALGGGQCGVVGASGVSQVISLSWRGGRPSLMWRGGSESAEMRRACIRISQEQNAAAARRGFKKTGVSSRHAVTCTDPLLCGAQAYDNHGEMAAGAKRLKLAAQREHDASGRLEELFQRGGHELLHPAAPSC